MPIVVAQVPLLGPSHISHGPSHVRSQQTPSTQNPDSHSPAIMQLSPSGAAGTSPLRKQAPRAHTYPSGHNPLGLQRTAPLGGLGLRQEPRRTINDTRRTRRVTVRTPPTSRRL